VRAGLTAPPRETPWSWVDEIRPAGGPALIAPAAVRLFDLDAPLVDLCLPRASGGRPYRSLLAIARVDGDPRGAATFPVGPSGRLSGRVLELGLRRELGWRGAQRTTGRRGDASTPNTSVTVVVTTCCNPPALERCLRSLLACDYADFEVIVVENRPGSAATRRMLATRFGDWPDLRYLEEPRAGLARARNAGLAAAQGDLVAFTDDDTVLDRSWIRRFVERFERSDDVDCVTGLILPLELETESQLLLEQFAAFGKGFEPRTYRLPEQRNGYPVYPYAPGSIGSGANTVARRAVALELGGFDTALGAGTPAAGGEDLDLYIRLILSGCAVAYEPGAIVWHQHPDGAGRLRSQVYRYGVGLGATLGKQLVRGPARQELLRSVPAGIRHARDPGSRKNAAKTDRYPHRLDWLERAGMLVGPFAYLVSSASGGRPPLRQGNPALPQPVLQHVLLENGKSVEVASFGNGVPGPAPAAARRPGPFDRALTATAVVACVVAPLVVALGLPLALRLPAVLALLCIAPGTALVTSLRGRAEAGLVVGASLAGTALLAQSMLWLGAWWPKAFLYALAVGCLSVFIVQALRRTLPPLRASQLRPTVAPERVRGISPGTAAHIGVIAIAIAAWASSVMGADLNRMAGIGLLNAMPPTYFLGFALLLAGFVSAVSRPVLSPKLLGAYVVALIVVLHGTTPLLYDQPRYPWTFTHIGVINFIAETGVVDRRVDIYNNWPGFFALCAWLSRLTGLSPAAYAEWAQVFFNLANVAALRFALRGVTGNQRLLWTATWLFVLGNWVAQDYLAPQAFAFVLALVAVGLALRSELRVRAPRTRPGVWLTHAIGRLRALLPHGRLVREPRPTSPVSPRGALLIGGLCYLAIVVSHQLTPMVLLAGITALALVARRIPLWVPLAMALVEVSWIALAWPYLSDHYALFDPNPAAGAAPAGYEAGKGLPGLVLAASAARVELLLFAVLAMIGLVRRLRARRWDLALAALVAAPVLIVGLNSYGGEGRYRFYLFALPWLCFFAAVACSPATSSRLPSVFRAWRLALATALAGGCLLFAYFGMELSNRVGSGDVAAAVWFERHAPADSLLVGLTPSFPRRLSARYPVVYARSHPGAPALSDHATYRGRGLDRRSLPRLETTLAAYDAPNTFLILTSSQQRFGRLFGLVPAGTSDRLARALRASSSFRLVYSRGAASIFRYRPGAEARRP
jgi:GT2 family glycosyltransferase